MGLNTAPLNDASQKAVTKKPAPRIVTPWTAPPREAVPRKATPHCATVKSRYFDVTSFSHRHALKHSTTGNGKPSNILTASLNNANFGWR